jgi:myosin heavy subunit
MSVASAFRKELRDLCARVAETDVQYVWCIRPNHNSSSTEYDVEYVAEQLR